jgi:hypothetical protein
MRRGGAKQVFRKEGEAFAPASPSPESPEKGQGKTKIRGGVFRNV